MIASMGRSLTAAVGTVAPLLLALKGLQALTAGFSEGMNFQDIKIGLGQKGFSQSQIDALSKSAISTSASGKTILTPVQQLEAAGGMLPILGAGNVQGALPELNRFTFAARKANVAVKNPEILARFWELYARRKPEERGAFDEALLKVLQVSGIPTETLLQQSSVYGAGLLGRDPISALSDVAYLSKESGAGLKGGMGGGRGRAGFALRTLDSMISSGKIPQATLELWHHLGRLPGLDKYLKPKGRGHSYLIEQGTGKHILAGAGQSVASSGAISKAAFLEYLSKERPEWMTMSGKSNEAMVRQFALMAGQQAGLKGTPMQILDQFYKLPDVKQKQLMATISGGNLLAETGIIQLGGAGRYKVSKDVWDQSIAGAKGFSALDGQTSIAQKWEIFTAQFDAFATAFTNTPQFLDAANKTMDTLIGIMRDLNNNVGLLAKPIALIYKPIDWIATKMGMAQSQTEANMYPNSRLATTSSSKYGGMAMFTAQQSAQIIADEAVKKGITDPKVINQGIAIAMQESHLDPSVTNKSGFRGLFQVGKFGSATAGKNISDTDAYNPHFAAANFWDRYKSVGNHPFHEMPNLVQRAWIPSTHTGDPYFNSRVQSLEPVAESFHVTVDVKGVPEHLVKTTVTAVNKQQAKTARKMSYATSKAGGAYTDSSHNSGGNQD